MMKAWVLDAYIIPNALTDDGSRSRDHTRFRRSGTSGKARSAASAPDPLQARRSSSSRRLFLRLAPILADCLLHAWRIAHASWASASRLERAVRDCYGS